MANNVSDLPVGPLRDLLAWLRKAKVKGLVIGGLAVAFVGRPRMTRDVDAVIFLDEVRWPSFLKQGKEFSFHSRIASPLPFARETRVFLLHHRTSGIDVDLTLGSLLFEREALDRAQKVKVGRLSLWVPTPEDLIILKVVADRPKDRIDVEGVLARHSTLDYARIRKYVGEFAGVLERPELFEEVDGLLSAHKEQQKESRKG